MQPSYLTDEPIDRESLVAEVMRDSDGAVAVFAGVVRNHHEGRQVESILYEAYRPMADKEIDAILHAVRSEIPDVAVTVRHRLGRLKVGDTSIVIACSSPHRAEAFDACRRVIDRIKQTVPIWKKERGENGDEWTGWQGGGTGPADSHQGSSSFSVTSAQLPTGAGSHADEVSIIPAASALVFRDDPFEILLFRRSEKSSFVPGAWVFPGGSVDESDRALAERCGREEIDVMKICALRELLEETGVWIGKRTPLLSHERRGLLDGSVSFGALAGTTALPLEKLIWTARWITPAGVPRRFDTWFFVTSVERGVEATADGVEGIETLWIAPQEALGRHKRGELPLMFPTMRNLEMASGFTSSADLIASRRAAKIETTRPILIVEGKNRRIILPSESEDAS